MILTLPLRFAGFSLLCFGGGYILIPVLFADLVTHRGILAANEFLNLVSIAQLTPGPVGINVATYSGYLEGGAWGSFAATAGFVLPTLFLSSLAVAGLRKYHDSFFVHGLMTGVRPAAVGMISYAALLFLRLSLFGENGAALKIDWISFAIFGITLVLMLKSKISAFRLIVCGAALGALSVLL